MLNTDKLHSAGIPSSQNWFLSSLWGTVQTYEAEINAPVSEKINILERILALAGEWLTSHRPKNTNTNRARWEALEDLANQVVREGVKLNARFLTGPTNWKTIGGGHADRSYWLEFLSPKHGVGFHLSPRYAAWRDSPGLAAELSFWDYMNMVDPFPSMMVKYYGETPKAEKRRVYFKEGHQLLRAIDDTPFDTRQLETAASGIGWGIFVVSPDGKMYAHKHIVGKYHHSTFLSGSAVLCAGEIVVDNGKVICITSKSGHYLPTPEDMRNMIKKFPQIPSQAIVIPDFRANPLPAYAVGEYKYTLTPKSLTQAKVRASIPGWAQQSTGALATIGKIA